MTYLSVDEENSYPAMGDMSRVMSRSRTGREFTDVATLGEAVGPGEKVWIRGRLHSIRAKGGSCFIVIRQDSFHTVQAVYFKNKEKPEESQKMMKYLKSLTAESVVDLMGTLKEADVKVRGTVAGYEGAVINSCTCLHFFSVIFFLYFSLSASHVRFRTWSSKLNGSTPCRRRIRFCPSWSKTRQGVRRRWKNRRTPNALFRGWGRKFGSITVGWICGKAEPEGPSFFCDESNALWRLSC